MPARRKNKIISALASVKFAYITMGLLMFIVVLCTLEQKQIGIHGAVQKYFRSLFLYGEFPGAGLRIPVFPAGGILGLALIVNVSLSMAFNLQRTARKAGIWLIHLGLVLLVAGEFITGIYSVESKMTIREGSSLNFSEDPRRSELAFVDLNRDDFERVYSITDSFLRTGKEFRHPAWPFTVRIKSYLPNAALGERPSGGAIPPSLADRGAGRRLVVRPVPSARPNGRRDMPAAFVEILEDGRTAGTWLVSAALDRHQMLTLGGKSYAFALRAKRYYVPYSITLKDFEREVYPGTGIPKKFSSLIRLDHPAKGESRDVLIEMNSPLRYLGKTFYQASYADDDKVSIFQVVENPGWLMPYAAFILMALGLLVHFTPRVVPSRWAGGRA